MYTVPSKNGHNAICKGRARRHGMRDFEALPITAQNGNLLQLLTRKLHSLNLHVIAHAEFVDGHELIATFQPGPRFDG